MGEILKAGFGRDKEIDRNVIDHSKKDTNFTNGVMNPLRYEEILILEREAPMKGLEHWMSKIGRGVSPFHRLSESKFESENFIESINSFGSSASKKKKFVNTMGSIPGEDNSPFCQGESSIFRPAEDKKPEDTQEDIPSPAQNDHLKQSLAIVKEIDSQIYNCTENDLNDLHIQSGALTSSILMKHPQNVANAQSAFGKSNLSIHLKSNYDLSVSQSPLSQAKSPLSQRRSRPSLMYVDQKATSKFYKKSLESQDVPDDVETKKITPEKNGAAEFFFQTEESSKKIKRGGNKSKKKNSSKPTKKFKSSKSLDQESKAEKLENIKNSEKNITREPQMFTY